MLHDIDTTTVFRCYPPESIPDVRMLLHSVRNDAAETLGRVKVTHRRS